MQQHSTYPFPPLTRSSPFQYPLLPIIKVRRPLLPLHPRIRLLHRIFHLPQMNTIMLRACHEQHALNPLPRPRDLQRLQKTLQDRAIDLPILLLGGFLDIRREEDVLGLHAVKLGGNLSRRSCEIDVPVLYVRRVLFFLRSGDCVDGGPLGGIFGQCEHDFAPEDACEGERGLEGRGEADLPVAPVTIADGIVYSESLEISDNYLYCNMYYLGMYGMEMIRDFRELCFQERNDDEL
jgi:hypothetical protein